MFYLTVLFVFFWNDHCYPKSWKQSQKPKLAVPFTWLKCITGCIICKGFEPAGAHRGYCSSRAPEPSVAARRPVPARDTAQVALMLWLVFNWACSKTYFRYFSSILQLEGFTGNSFTRSVWSCYCYPIKWQIHTEMIFGCKIIFPLNMTSSFAVTRMWNFPCM